MPPRAPPLSALPRLYVRVTIRPYSDQKARFEDQKIDRTLRWWRGAKVNSAYKSGPRISVVPKIRDGKIIEQTPEEVLAAREFVPELKKAQHKDVEREKEYAMEFRRLEEFERLQRAKEGYKTEGAKRMFLRGLTERINTLHEERQDEILARKTFDGEEDPQVEQIWLDDVVVHDNHAPPRDVVGSKFQKEKEKIKIHLYLSGGFV
jgi:hypothetical protein